MCEYSNSLPTSSNSNNNGKKTHMEAFLCKTRGKTAHPKQIQKFKKIKWCQKHLTIQFT